MVTSLLDTSVLVDVLQQHPPAKTWFAQQTQPGIPSIVWIELLQGVPNRNAERRALRILNKFARIDLTVSDVDWAIQQLTRYKLSHNIGGLDCLIASTSHRLQIPLYTTNLRHFTPLLSSLVKKPY
jgi:predicted nucleic acid-binding protein